MALRPCRECGHEVSTGAAACPHCGVGAPTGAMPRRDKGGRRILTWLGMTLGAFFVIGLLGESLSTPAPEPAAPPAATAADSALAARAVCELAVKNKLTSPTEARFPPFSMKRETQTGEAGHFVGRGEVVAPNPMGVSITSRFVCVVDTEADVANAVFRSSNPELYDEMVRMFGL